MWVAIGAVAALLLVVLYFLFRSKSATKARPDFAAGGLVTASDSGAAGLEGKQEETSEDAVPITFFFGSQTGTAEGFAKTLAGECKRFGFKPTVTDLEDFEPDEFKEIAADGGVVCFLMATYGEGEPTDNAAQFYEWLMDKDQELEGAELTGMRYTVFGLGNRQYEHFNKMGRVTAKRLTALGAEEIYKCGEGDDDGTLDEDFEEWKEDMWEAMQKAVGVSGGEGAGGGEGGLPPLADLEWKVSYLRAPPSRAEVEAGRTAVVPSTVALSSRYYFTSEPAKVLANRELRQGGEGSTRHIELELKDTSLTYTSADNLGVLAENHPVIVESLARWMGYDPDRYFVLERTESEAGAAAKPLFPTPCTVRQALSRYCDLNSFARKDLLTQLAHFATKDTEKNKLMHLVSKAGKADFTETIVKQKMSVYEVLEMFPSCRVPVDRLFQMVPRLAPRLYTICSSSRVHAGRVHAVVSVVKEPKPGGREFLGVCSNYMQRTQPPETEGGRRTDGDESKTGGRGPWPTMMVHVRPSTFTLPEDQSLPVIMVGPGTGVAPMRAFCQERRFWREQGRKVGKTVLFFGCRRRTEDFIYKEEMEEFFRDGTLTSLELAFSREDPGRKVYVQDKLREHKDMVWELLCAGAHFYVCGGTHMGNDVQAVVESIADEHSAETGHSGADYVKRMHSEKRYVAELWS